MTKQEAIDVLKSECYVFNPLNFDRTTLINTALDVTIESLKQPYDQVKWERDIAISQLEELGYSLGEKKEPCIPTRDLSDKELKHFAEKMKKVRVQVVKQESILDKIRAEILEEKECAYADFERYKVDYLGQDLEDVQDSLPQDDFRYGMERCIEIIDKYKAESEVTDADSN